MTNEKNEKLEYLFVTFEKEISFFFKSSAEEKINRSAAANSLLTQGNILVEIYPFLHGTKTILSAKDKSQEIKNKIANAWKMLIHEIAEKNGCTGIPSTDIPLEGWFHWMRYLLAQNA